MISPTESLKLHSVVALYIFQSNSILLPRMYAVKMTVVQLNVYT